MYFSAGKSVLFSTSQSRNFHHVKGSRSHAVNFRGKQGEFDLHACTNRRLWLHTSEKASFEKWVENRVKFEPDYI